MHLNRLSLLLAIPLGVTHRCPPEHHAPDSVTIPRAEYVDRLRGSLAGQSFGLAWGFARGIEFRYRRRTVPDHDFSDPTTIDARIAFRAPAGDDMYTEAAGVRALLEHGIGATWDQLANHYRSTQFPLWHSDARMRQNLRAGIAAPACGHFTHQIEGERFGHADDLDAQMQVDFCGAICPGDPDAAITLAWKVGHLMGYGDGAIGACVMAAMNAEAYVAEDVASIVHAGVRAAPTGSRYRALLDDVERWHSKWPNDWKRTWRALDERWGTDDRCPIGNGGGRMNDAAFNIDAKMHGGSVLMGLLYGDGDFLRSLEVTIRCGQDTDTSAQNLGSILGAFHGARALPEFVTRWIDAPDAPTLEGTVWTPRDLVRVQTQLAEDVVRMRGRSIGDSGSFSIPRAPWEPVLCEQWPREDSKPLELEVATDRSEDGSFRFFATVRGGTATEIEWHFGDLTRAKGTRASHRYSRPGRYEATCYATNEEGRSSIASVVVDHPGVR